MKKSDLILAKKTIAAKLVKEQSKALKNELASKKGQQPSSGQTFTSTAAATLQQGRLPKSQSLPALSVVTSPTSSMGRSMDPLLSTHSQPERESANFFEQSLSSSGQALAEQLSNRSITEKTQLRKLQQSVSQSMEKSLRPTTTNSHRMSGVSLESPSQTRAVDDENYFMPKRKLLRPDGASLLDIYESKKADMWGQIIKAQYREDESRKVVDHHNHLFKNKEYGDRLRRQVLDNEARKSKAMHEHNDFAQLEGATAKRYEDLEKQRNEDAVRRHKQFIQHAMEDIELKRRKKEQELREELTASAIMVNHAKDLIEHDELMKLKNKDYHRRYQEQIFQENVDNIERKKRLKDFEQREDKRIIEENERQYQREMARREQEFNTKMTNSSEGPAHHIVRSILQRKKQREDAMSQTMLSLDNSLNRQLRLSEELAAQRARKNGESLSDEWKRNTQLRLQKKKEEEDRNNNILSTMRSMLARQEHEDCALKQQRREAALRYQHELDAQVQALRQRSIDSLTKTMSEQERKYNRDLIQKTAAFL